MSQAEDLLESLSTGNSGILEPHIIIDKKRKVSVPDELKRIAVQHDHNIETVTFDCPRYWDGNDMSQSRICINYKRPDGALGSCVAGNVIVDDTDESIMHFDWMISQDVTVKDGSLTFLVCIKKIDADTGEEINNWHSELNTEMYISKGLECDKIVDGAYSELVSY